MEVEETEDSLTVHGQGNKVAGGTLIKTHSDHRIAMSFICLNLVSKNPIRVDETDSINTSFKEFFQSMANIGVSFE